MEVIQTDIWVRFQRMRGHECYYICADDAHGTPIMIRADNENTSPEELIKAQHTTHLADYRDFSISFDNYYTTHSDYNRQFSEQIYKRCKDKKRILQKRIVQAYDSEKRIFLSDRYVRGECPQCGAAGQYGDNCEQCGANYSPFDLKNPISTLSGSVPVKRDSMHYFFTLSHSHAAIEEWIKNAPLQPQVVAKLREWLDAGLQDWDISRDEPYFGFEIPDAPGKYFYVWLDAPIGYMATWKDYCKRNKIQFEHWWHANSTTELYHFIGKDIINFHGLFWTALLHTADYRLPSALFAHGFLTVNGEKMSKSRNTFILARNYLKHMNADYLRYYFAAKLDSSVRDIDLNMEDFRHRINAELVGKIINLASRCAPFIHRNGTGCLTQTVTPSPLNEAVACAQSIAQLYEAREYASLIRQLNALADQANRFIDEHKPWRLAKENPENPLIQDVCSTGIALFRLLMLYLKPVMPQMVGEAERFLNEELSWDSIAQDMTGHKLGEYQPLATRVEQKNSDAMLSEPVPTL